MKATVADLKAMLGRFSAFNKISPNGHGHKVAAFLRLCGALEPALVFIDSNQRAEWLDVVAEVHDWLDRRGIDGFALDRQRLERLYELASDSDLKSEATGLFEFVANPKLRSIVDSNYAALLWAIRADQHQLVCVVVGALAETLLLDAAMIAPNYSDDLLHATFGKLVKHCSRADVGILDDKARPLAETMRDWRDFIHPGVQFRNEVQVDGAEALAAPGQLGTLSKHIRRWHSSR